MKRSVLIVILMSLSACSLVQLLPSSDCQYVEYVRVNNLVTVKAECELWNRLPTPTQTNMF